MHSSSLKAGKIILGLEDSSAEDSLVEPIQGTDPGIQTMFCFLHHQLENLSHFVPHTQEGEFPTRHHGSEDLPQ